MLRRAADGDPAGRLFPDLRHRDALPAGKIIAGDRSRTVDQVLCGPHCHDLAAVLAGTGTDVDDRIRGPHGLFIVFDHEHAVAEVAQML